MYRRAALRGLPGLFWLPATDRRSALAGLRRHRRGSVPGARRAGTDGDRSGRLDSKSDLELMESVRRGDRTALAELYDRHAAAMLGLAYRILRNRSDAEDLVHDVFIEAWRKAASWSAERGGVRAWLLVRVRSRAIDRTRSLAVMRRHAEAQQAAPEPHAARASPADPSLSPDQTSARAALAALSAEQRAVLELAYFEGLSCAEIAARCGTPLGTVKSRLGAGLKLLRERFAVVEGAR